MRSLCGDWNVIQNDVESWGHICRDGSSHRLGKEFVVCVVQREAVHVRSNGGGDEKSCEIELFSHSVVLVPLAVNVS